MTAPVYVGRFAPSPTGPLHAGSIVAAVASFLDARARGGQWLVRIEDIDGPRTVPGADQAILRTLARLGMHSDLPVVWQSAREGLYDRAHQRLREQGWIYPCGCSRREIADSQIESPFAPMPAEPIYPGTCRGGLAAGRSPRSWRVRVEGDRIAWQDRHAGEQGEVLARSIGDFVVRRADGPWAYQLAVVVDDAEQGVTDVVRGADLMGSTARQIHLQSLLGLARPRYLHVPVVLGADGRKLSKQNEAQPVDGLAPQDALASALRHLGIEPVRDHSLDGLWRQAISRWRLSPWFSQA